MPLSFRPQVEHEGSGRGCDDGRKIPWKGRQAGRETDVVALRSTGNERRRGSPIAIHNDARHSRPWPASWIPEAPGSEWFPSSAGLLGGGRLAEGEMPAAPPDLTRIGSPAGTLW